METSQKCHGHLVYTTDVHPALSQVSHIYWYTRLEIAQYLSHLPSMSSRGLSSVAPCTRSSIASQHSTCSARALQHVAT